MPAAILDFLITALGWIGAVGAVIAYTMVTKGKWTPKGLSFQVTNLVSATLLCLVAGYHNVWPSMAANVVWIVVGLQAVAVVTRAQFRRLRAESPDVEPKVSLVA